MEEHVVRILETGSITHNVKYFRVERPKNYFFTPGQATEVSVNTPELRDERRPFTFTATTFAPYLEFVIKRYPDHHGVTDAIHRLNVGDTLLIHDIFGAIKFKGKGYFIAGGAGITPFISIFRELNLTGEAAGNFLIFANRTGNDIILEEELRSILGSNYINILSDEISPEYEHGLIDQDFLKRYIKDNTSEFYVCGPPPMMNMVLYELKDFGIPERRIIVEEM
jgi:ferredoxin-NADP reductase